MQKKYDELLDNIAARVALNVGLIRHYTRSEQI
jgi:hypothetical protein